jgi:hypothetical protein
LYGWQSAYAALAPPQVIFEGYSQAIEGDVHHSTCTNTYTQTATVSPPSNINNGDTLIVILEAGVAKIGTVPTMPPGWALLPMANNANNPTLNIVENSCGAYNHAWIAVHQYSGSDSVPYSFSQSIKPASNTCGSGCYEGELGGFLVAYRGASADLSQYLAYGYPSSYPNYAEASIAASQSVAASRELVTIFQGEGNDPDETTACDTFGVIGGSPALIPETPSQLPCNNWSFYAADVWTGSAGGTFGTYAVRPSGVSVYGMAALPAFQLVLPPQTP